ncbi:prepilin peptidase [Candidatus Woesearchaeota archaeon]|nr:prepilin peptidase [Candidatus Woesearchaeota archaeon]
MVFTYFLIVIAFIWLIFAAIVDIKKKEVPNWLNYSLIAIGFGARIIYSLIFNDYKIFLFGIIGFIACFIFGNLMYYTRQWGGGDAKLIMGLGAMFGDYKIGSIINQNIELPFLVVLIINILLAGLVYSIFYSIFLAIKNKEKFVKAWNKEKSYLIIGIITIATILSVGLYFSIDELFATIIVFLILIFSVLFVSLIFIRAVEQSCLINYIGVNKITEGDWLFSDVKVKNRIICYSKNTGLSIEDINQIKKSKIRKVLIKEGIPFVPAFLLGFIMTIIFGSVLF